MVTTQKNTYNDIQLLYKVIKSDRADLLDKMLSHKPHLASYSNKKGETLLSYALKTNAPHIIEYLTHKHPYLLSQKNRNNEDLLEFLIRSGKTSPLQVLMNSFDEQQIKQIFSLPRIKPLFIHAAQQLDKEFWKEFLDLTHHLITQKDIEYLNEDGLNFLHYLAFNNKQYIEPIKQRILEEQFYQIDNLTGATPLLMAARYAGKDLLLYMLEHSDREQTTFMNSHLTHAATLNPNSTVLEEIVQQGLDSTQEDYHHQTPLMIAALNKDVYKAEILLPKYQHLDISQEVLQASRQFIVFKSLFENNIQHLTKEQLLSLSEDKEKIAAFFSFVFYYCDDKFLINLSKTSVCELLDELKNEPFLAHQIYLSSITGRRAMSKKIKFLQNYLPILHADETELYYSATEDSKNITFEQEVTSNDDFSQYQKGFCLVAALGLLPDGQLKEVLANSQILGAFNEADKFLLNALVISRKTLSLSDFLQPVTPLLNLNNNFNHIIGSYLSKYQLQASTQKNYGKLILALEHFPHDAIREVVRSELKKNPDNLNIFQLLGNKEYHKELYLLICEELLCMDKPSEQLTQTFKKNPKFLFFSFKQTLKQRPLDIKLNEFTQYILHHEGFTHGAHNWKLILPIAQTSGNEKIVKALLPTVSMNHQKDFMVFQQQLQGVTLSDSAWRCIFNHFNHSEFFPYILNQYLLDVSRNDEQSNSNTLLKVSEQISPEYTNTKIWMDNIIQSQNHKDLSILIFEKLYLSKHSALDLAHMSLQRENISYLRHMIDYHDVNINDVPLEEFWTNHAMSSHFELSLINKSYLPFDNFAAFLKEHQTKLNTQSVNGIMQGLCKWLHQTSVDGTTKLGILYGIFHAMDCHINFIDDVLLLNISNISLQMIDADNMFGKVANQNTVNNFFRLILNHSDNAFLKLLNDNLNQNNEKNKLSEDNQKIMNYYELQAKIKSDKTIAKKRLKI